MSFEVALTSALLNYMLYLIYCTGKQKQQQQQTNKQKKKKTLTQDHG